ncbi:MAG: DUF1398 domain-containing protein [Agriterribacter sp.]
MFTIEQIKASHALVKSGADFPSHIQRLIAMGVTGYENYVANGSTRFKGKNDYTTQASAKYAAQSIAEKPDIKGLKEALSIHQQGQTDYLTFCRQAAEAGVEKWVVDTIKMTCIYYDKKGNEMVKEVIPSV